MANKTSIIERLEVKNGVYKGEIPLLYLKVSQGSTSVHLGTTHDYLFSRSTEEEVALELQNLFLLRKKDEKSFWEALILKYTVSPSKILPKKAYTSITSKGKVEDENDNWFRGAWFLGTFHFFEKYPQYLTYDRPTEQIINSILKGPVNQKATIKKELTKADEIGESVKAEQRDADNKDVKGIKEKIKASKSKKSKKAVSLEEGTVDKDKKALLSKLKKLKKGKKVKALQ